MFNRMQPANGFSHDSRTLRVELNRFPRAGAICRLSVVASLFVVVVICIVAKQCEIELRLLFH